MGHVDRLDKNIHKVLLQDDLIANTTGSKLLLLSDSEIGCVLHATEGPVTEPHSRENRCESTEVRVAQCWPSQKTI